MSSDSEVIVGEPSLDLSSNDVNKNDDYEEISNESGSETNDSSEEDEDGPQEDENIPEKSLNEVNQNFIIMCKTLTNGLSTLALRGVLFYGTCMYYLKLFLNKMYESNSNVAFAMDYSEYLKEYLSNLLCDTKTEPFYANWTSISYIKFHTERMPDYNELIVSVPHNWFSVKSFDNINQCLMIEYDKGNTTNEMDEPLFITKYNILGVSRYYVCHQVPKHLDLNERIPSNVRFISIVYTHPKMTKQLTLELSKNWYNVHNQLFTPEFVFRLLEYQKESYVFDPQYKILLIDNNINNETLTIDKYIEILEDEYIIKSTGS